MTDLLKIQHPVLLAGMNVAAGPRLAAAVTNAGGLGVIGGVGYTPDMLREQISELKSFLKDKSAPFGVDLLIPQVGGNARKTKFVLLSPATTAPLVEVEANSLRLVATTTPRASSMSSSPSSSTAGPSSSFPPSVSLPDTSSTASTRLACYT